MRRSLVSRVPLVLCVLFLFLTSACGGSAHTQELRTSLVALNVARDTLRVTSREREQQIVDGCDPPECTKAQGRAQLDAWRASVDKVTALIAEGYDAVLAALILSDAKSAGLASAVVKEALNLADGLKTLPVPVGPSEDSPSKETTP